MAGAHDAGIDYGVLAADIAADNMAAHIAAVLQSADAVMGGQQPDRGRIPISSEPVANMMAAIRVGVRDRSALHFCEGEEFIHVPWYMSSLTHSGMNGGEIGASASPDSSVRSEPETSEKADTSKLISAGHESFDLIFMMLLGIRTAISKFANVPQREDDKWDGDFLAKGSADTPAHTQQDFRFRDFSPLVFRQIREHFGVTNEEYLLSLTSEYVLVEMFTNSKSGSFFYYSTDYRFILKTCTKNEAAFLIKALPRYHGHLMAHRYTLLCRFFGLHCVHLPTTLGNEVYFVVMGNVLPIDKPIH